MSTFLQICGILWLVSVGAGGLWVGLCLWASRKNRLGTMHEIPRPVGGYIPVVWPGHRWCEKHETQWVRGEISGTIYEWCPDCKLEVVGEARDV